MNDKEIKKKFKDIFYTDPDKYYATGVLKAEGFVRGICETCQKPFWSTDSQRKVCGDAMCCGGFSFFGNTPASNKMDYIEAWQKFAQLFEQWGYTPIPRYPVVARWREDTEFVQASIYDFQPFVVSGEVKPPANPLVVPQLCLRFNDVDNVGITGAHFTGFVMIGQHTFLPPSEWNQEKYFRDIYNWLLQGLGLPKEEIVFHEDVWAGGGNFGPCMEFFSRGLELGNQVYMTNVVKDDGSIEELQLKVLDMGMGLERNAWFSKGTSTSYESVFPTVCEKLFKLTGVKVDPELMNKFLPYSSYLNVDEVDDIDAVWGDIAQKIGVAKEELKEKVLPVAALFSIGEHARTLLVAITDGSLPSNVGGGYNLRMLLRRALGFIDKYNWNVQLIDVCTWHAEYLKPIFPELSDNLDVVEQVLDVEKQKYENTKQKTKAIVQSLIKKGDITTDTLLEIYDSQGISPELVKEAAREEGISVNVPDDFYMQVAQRHESNEQTTKLKTKRDLGLGPLPESEGKYYDDYLKLTFDAEVIFAQDNYVVLNETYFYPTSGGQEHDTGEMRVNEESYQVKDVVKQGAAIVHILDRPVTCEKGTIASCEITKDRRVQLTQHHTATHIVNAAAKRVIGKHVNQAGAKKTVEKGQIDLTHYQSMTEEEVSKIEAEANRIIEEDVEVRTQFMPRNDAEQKFGVFIYQGGVVPGKTLRIVDIVEVDVEACGGTHVRSTKEVGTLKILKSSKIQDGIVRLQYTAGAAAQAASGEEDAIVTQACELLGIEKELLPKRCDELFNKWKKGKKLMGKLKNQQYVELIKKGEVQADLDLSSTEKSSSGDVLSETAKILRTQAEHIPKTIARFKKELDEFRDKLNAALKE